MFDKLKNIDTSDALYGAGLVILNKAKEKVPYQTGTLRRSLTLQASGSRLLIGSNLSYAAIHEFGGTIKSKSGEYLHFRVEGSWRKVRKVNIPARPYLRPAILEGRVEAIETFKKILRKQL